MSDYIPEMNHITKEFSGVKALDDVNLKVKRGETIPLMIRSSVNSSTPLIKVSIVCPSRITVMESAT